MKAFLAALALVLGADVTIDGTGYSLAFIDTLSPKAITSNSTRTRFVASTLVYDAGVVDAGPTAAFRFASPNNLAGISGGACACQPVTLVDGTPLTNGRETGGYCTKTATTTGGFARSGIGVGDLVWCDAGIPRIEYLANGQLGYLNEPDTRNVFCSSDLTNACWFKDGLNGGSNPVVTSGAVGPTGFADSYFVSISGCAPLNAFSTVYTQVTTSGLSSPMTASYYLTAVGDAGRVSAWSVSPSDAVYRTAQYDVPNDGGFVRVVFEVGYGVTLFTGFGCENEAILPGHVDTGPINLIAFGPQLEYGPQRVNNSQHRDVTSYVPAGTTRAADRYLSATISNLGQNFCASAQVQFDSVLTASEGDHATESMLFIGSDNTNKSLRSFENNSASWITDFGAVANTLSTTINAGTVYSAYAGFLLDGGRANTFDGVTAYTGSGSPQATSTYVSIGGYLDGGNTLSIITNVQIDPNVTVCQ